MRDAGHGGRHHRERRHPRGAPQPVRARRRRGPRARPLGRRRSRSTTAGRWTSSGPATVAPARCSSCRPARRRCSRTPAPAPSRPTALDATGDVVVARPRHRRRPSRPGAVQRIASADDIDEFEDGAVLVTEMTDPDWVPIMTQGRGDRHRPRRADLARRHRQPASWACPPIVGTGDATEILAGRPGGDVSCVEGDEGYVYEGIARLLGRGPRPRRRARDPDPGHAEHRQPGRGHAAGGACPRDGDRARPHGVPRQQRRSRPTRWRCCTPTRSTTTPGRRSRS